MKKITQKSKIAEKSNNLEECGENINLNVSTNENPNHRACDFTSAFRRNYASNPLNDTQTFNKNAKTRTIENCRGAQCASVLQRTIPKNAGITLIALIITIIILLILAGITLNFVLGENGILNKAKYASEKYTNAQTKENMGLEDIENKMDNIIQGGNLRRRFKRKRTSYIR